MIPLQGRHMERTLSSFFIIVSFLLDVAAVRNVNSINTVYFRI
jgi:hypothetical protein